MFSAVGGMAHECSAFYKRLAGRITDKRGQEFAVIMNWVRIKLRFSLLRSTLVCLRGSRCHKATYERVADIDIALAAAQCGLNK